MNDTKVVQGPVTEGVFEEGFSVSRRSVLTEQLLPARRPAVQRRREVRATRPESEPAKTRPV